MPPSPTLLSHFLLATSHAPHGAVELLLQPPTAFATPNLDLILTQIHASGLIAYALETSSLNCKSEEVVLPPISRGYLADLADSFFGSYMSALVRLDPLLERILFVVRCNSSDCSRFVS